MAKDFVSASHFNSNLNFCRVSQVKVLCVHTSLFVKAMLFLLLQLMEMKPLQLFGSHWHNLCMSSTVIMKIILINATDSHQFEFPATLWTGMDHVNKWSFKPKLLSMLSVLRFYDINYLNNCYQKVYKQSLQTRLLNKNLD